MKNTIKNKKGNVTLALGGGLLLAAIIIVVVVFLLALAGVLGTGIWLVSLIVKNIFYIIGALIIILGMLYGIERAENPAVFIIIVALIGGSLMLINFLNLQQTMFPSLSQQDNTIIITPTEERIDGCTTIDSCITYLKSIGMPDNYLETNNLKIECKNEVCYVKKK